MKMEKVTCRITSSHQYKFLQIYRRPLVEESKRRGKEVFRLIRTETCYYKEDGTFVGDAIDILEDIVIGTDQEIREYIKEKEERRNRERAMEVMLKEFPHLKEEDIKLEKVKKEDN